MTLTPRALIAIGLLIVWSAAPGSAAPTRAGTDARSAGRVSATRRDAAPARAASGAKARRRSAGDAKEPAVSAPTRPAAAPRRLEDIHIEGEIPAPQVLFVTAHDQRRVTRFHHQRYLKTALRVGEETPLPTRITTTRGPAIPSTTR